jgi:phage tail protein X
VRFEELKHAWHGLAGAQHILPVGLLVRMIPNAPEEFEVERDDKLA